MVLDWCYCSSRRKTDDESRGRAGPATPSDAVRDADVVIAMLANDDASRDVWLGEHGALAAMRSDAIAIESSTLTTEWIKDLANATRRIFHRGTSGQADDAVFGCVIGRASG
jgi:3-hydroxyisobutyrate dehydrogenase-like beta-hydroxyacid dehydrogenase